MIKRALLVVPVLIVALMFAFLLGQRTGSNTVSISEADIDIPVADTSSGDGELQEQPQLTSALDQPVPPADTRPASVFRLADGDSFEILWADNGDLDEVRLIGLNAPEGDACFGQESRKVLETLTRDLDLEVETIERDEFGRVLANVWVDGLFVNGTLVELGAALALSDGGRHGSFIESAQQTAQSNLAGLWAPDACGADPDAALSIAWIEANAPGQDHLNKNGEWIDISNDGDQEVDLTDWSIRDESTRHRYYFPDNFLLGPGDEVRVFSGCGDDTQNDLYWCDDDPVWNNGGDTGFLVDPDGKFVDTRTYGG